MTAQRRPSATRFQSTLPVGGATHERRRLPFIHRISIHAPRGGSDGQGFMTTLLITYFNPRSPWGERHHACVVGDTLIYFNPRSPWGERRGGLLDHQGFGLFQSTLPVGGATMHLGYTRKAAEFQSTLPVGGATLVVRGVVRPLLISIHAPRGGSDSSIAIMSRSST